MITVSLTRRAIQREGACSDWLALFDSIKSLADEQRARDGKPEIASLKVRWTRIHTIWAAVAYPSFFGWMLERGLIPSANLAGANLAGAYLARANLAGSRRRRTDPAIDGWEVVGAECDCCPFPLRRRAAKEGV